MDYAALFSVILHDDNVQEFDTRLDELLLSMSKIPSDGVLESLYKMRIRESDQLKTELELCDLEIHQKIPMPDYQKMKTMVKRSVDLILRLPNFDAKNGRIEARSSGYESQGQRGVESGQCECYQWKARGQCSRGDNCSFRHDEDNRAKTHTKNRSTL